MFTTLEVASLTQATRRRHDFDAVLSLMDPDCRSSQRLRFHRPARPAHLTLLFDDLEVEHATAPTAAHVAEALAFARAAHGRLLVHCHAGVSRSGALGYALWADLFGPGREVEALDRLLAQRPEACPNGRLVRHADVALGRGGALLAAYEARLAARADWQALKARQRHAWTNDLPHLFGEANAPSLDAPLLESVAAER